MRRVYTLLLIKVKTTEEREGIQNKQMSQLYTAIRETTSDFVKLGSESSQWVLNPDNMADDLADF